MLHFLARIRICLFAWIRIKIKMTLIRHHCMVMSILHMKVTCKKIGWVIFCDIFHPRHFIGHWKKQSGLFFYLYSFHLLRFFYFYIVIIFTFYLLICSWSIKRIFSKYDSYTTAAKNQIFFPVILYPVQCTSTQIIQSDKMYVRVGDSQNCSMCTVQFILWILDCTVEAVDLNQIFTE